MRNNTITDNETKLKNLALKILWQDDPGTRIGWNTYEHDKYEGKEQVAYDILEILNVDPYTGEEK